MCIIAYMQIAHVNPARVDTPAWECVQTCRLLLISQRLVGVQTDRPHADDSQGHITVQGWKLKDLQMV